jgi:hypothetical protein
MVCAVDGSDRSDPTGGHAGHEARAQGESGLRWGQAAPLTSAPSASYARVLTSAPSASYARVLTMALSASYARVLTMAVGRRCATVGGLFGAAPGRPLCLVNLLVQEVAVPEERGKERRSAMHSSALGSAIRWAIICNP